MNSSTSREHSSAKLWVLLVAIGVAIIAACGFAKPAWADVMGEGTKSSPWIVTSGQDFADVLEKTPTGTGYIKLQAASENTVTATNNLIFDNAWNINLNGQTLQMDSGESKYAFALSGGSTVTITDSSSTKSGKICGSRNTNVVIDLNVRTGREAEASLIINGGTISANTPGNAVVVQNATLTLNDGAIENTNATGRAIQVGAPPQAKGEPAVGSFIMNGGSVKSQVTGINVLYGSCSLNGGTVTAGKIGEDEKGSLSAVSVDNKAELTINGATINAPGSSLPDKPQGSNGGGGISVFGSATLNVLSGNISGSRAIGTNGSETTGATINVSGGTLTGSSEGSAFYLPSPAGQNQNTVNISGGTISGGVGVANLGSKLTVTGNPGPTITSTAGDADSLTIGDGKVQFPPAGIVNGVAAEGKNYNQNTEATVEGGTISGGEYGQGIVNGIPGGSDAGSNPNGTPSLTVSGNALIEGDVTNNTAGKTTINGGTITGTVANNGSGTTEYVAGTVEGGFQGNITEPAPAPGDPQAIQTAVSGVVTPVTEAMAPYADVTVSADAYTWTVETTNGETPITTVANDLVAPIVAALNAAGSSSATSIQNPAVTITLAGSTLASQQSFALDVLENAVAIAPASLGPDATLSDLQGMTASISAETTSNALTYTFIFAGESPTPPANEVTIYRLYNPYEEYHLYTKNVEEYEFLSTHGWNDEGIYWYAPAEAYEGTYTIIRLYNPYNGDHYYVMESDTEQIEFLTDAGWVPDNEEASFLSAPVDGPYPVYTLFNPFSQVNTHVYTPHEAEVETLEAAGMQINTTIIWAEALPPAAE